MHKFAVLIGLTLAFTVACDTETTEPQQEQQETEEVVEEEADPQEEEEARAPRTNETDTPDDELIGQLPDDIGIAAGESAPDAAAHDTDGDEVNLLDLIDDEAILVFFYRGGWCPYCNFQVREITEAYGDFSDRGVRPVAISVDKQEAAADTSATYDIPFPVLSDPDLVAHDAFNVTYQADEDEVEKLAGFGMDIEEASGRDHNKYAVPAVFIIDKEGTILWSHANLDYSIRPSTDQLLGVLDGLFE